MDLQLLQQKTVDLQKRFATQLDKRDVMIDLAEEVGELAQAILIVEKRKKTNDPAKQRSISDVANALGDILFDVLVMAERYGLDLDTEYGKVMEELSDRITKGEFDGEER